MNFIPVKSNLPHTGNFEWSVIMISMVLSAIGLCLIYSATAPLGEAGRQYVLRQITWCSLGLVAAAVLLIFDYELLDHWAVRIYIIIIVALIIVWTMGKVTAGSKRWMHMGLIRFQPSEFAKLAVIIILARCLKTVPGNSSTQLLDLLRPLLLVIVPIILVVLQPDLGTACVITLVAASMVLFAGVGRRLLLWTGIGLAVLVPVALLLGNQILMGYQKRRLFSFLNPSYDPLGSGYHLLQSQIAIGSGGLLGKGFLQGTQNQLMFLPVKHTDFIFSILAEEWGFIGCAVVLILFLGLLLRGMTIAGKARDNFGTLLAFGCTVSIFWHVMINVGMVMGLLPVAGVPLTFLSYGGSAILSSFLAVSIISNVAMRRSAYY
jgi:rod shape determining protein RodA